MVNEPRNAPVPNRSKKRFYIGMVVAIFLGIILAVLILPNLLAMIDDSPAVSDDFQITIPDGADGLERIDVTD